MSPSEPPWMCRWLDDSTCICLNILFITAASCASGHQASGVTFGVCTTQAMLLICDGSKPKWSHFLTFFPLKDGIYVLSLSLVMASSSGATKDHAAPSRFPYSLRGKHQDCHAKEATCRCSGVCGLSWALGQHLALADSHADHYFGCSDYLHFQMTTAQLTSDSKGMGNPKSDRPSPALPKFLTQNSGAG